MRKNVARIAAAALLALGALVAVVAVRTHSIGGTPQPAALSVPAWHIDATAAAGRLAEAIRFETVSHDDQPDASRDALDALGAWLVEAYPRFHAVATRTVMDGGTLVYEWQGSSEALRPIILMAHQDVVPAEAAQDWRHPPFSGAIAEGSIWGRGSIDNKGALVAIMEAVEAMVVAGVAPQRTLLLVFGHDEEVGGSGARAAARYLASQGIEAEFVLDEGSLVVADHPVTSKAVALIGISEKGFANVRITARSSGGHASAPPADTAIGVLAQAIDAVMSRPFLRRYAGTTRAMLQALAPEAPFVPRMAIANDWLFRPMLVNSLGASAQGDAMLHTTIAPTMLAGSPKQNVLPAEASATFNLRIAPGDSVEAALAHLRDAVKSLPVSVDLVGDSQEPSVVSPVDVAAFDLIAGAARAAFDVPVAPAPVIAATDSRHFAPLSPNIYRFQPLQLRLEDIDRIHGTDERLDVEALGRMIAFYGALIGAGTARQVPGHSRQ